MSHQRSLRKKMKKSVCMVKTGVAFPTVKGGTDWCREHLKGR